MALITCKHCGKRISSQYQQCPHCDQNPQTRTPEEVSPANPKRRRLKHLSQDLGNLSLLLMVVGALWFYKDSQGLSQPAGAGPVWLMAAGGSLYLYLRVWWWLRRMRHKKEQQEP